MNDNNHYGDMQQFELKNGITPEASGLLRELKKLIGAANEERFNKAGAVKEKLRHLKESIDSVGDEKEMLKEWPVALTVYMSKLYDALIGAGATKEDLCTPEGYNQIN